MSAQSTEHHADRDGRREPLRSVSADADRPDREGDGQTVVAGTPVVVRRNAGLSALIGAGASAIAIAYLWRGSQSGLTLDWALCAVMALIAAYYLSTLLDSRTPLLVADDLGVRIRLGSQWRGLPWEAVDQVVVEPRRGPFRDGRLVFSPHSLGRALDGLDGRARRQARLNQKLYGAALAVPLGLTTRVSVDGAEALEEGIAALAHGRADVVVLQPEPQPGTARAAATAESGRTAGDEPGADPAADVGVQPAVAAAAPAPRRPRWHLRWAGSPVQGEGREEAAEEVVADADPAGDPAGDPGR